MKDHYQVPTSQVQEVRDATDIVALISEYLPLKKAGVNFKGLCPFHKEKTPSFIVSQQKQIYHCFGCAEGGNAFDFIMKIQSLSFKEALERLSSRAGIQLRSFRGPGQGKEKETIFELNRIAADYYRSLLLDPKTGSQALKYLEDRGLDRKTIERFGLGYSLPSWDGLARYLKYKKVDLKEAERAGLLIAKSKSPDFYDRFRGRVIFPIINIEGKIIGFGGRTLTGDEAKYLNSPESAVFSKRNSFYGLDMQASKGLREAGFAIVVEGYMDLISLKMHGFENSLATLGTAFTNEHGKMLKRFTDTVYITFDSDEAGLSAVKRVLKPVLVSSLNAKVIALPKPHDPDTFLKEKGKREFEKLVDNAMGLIDFYIKHYFGEEVNLVGKAKVLEDIRDIFREVPSQFERELLIKKVSELTGIKENLFTEDPSKRPPARQAVSRKAVIPKEELLLVRLLLDEPRLLKNAKEGRILDFITLQEVKDLVLRIIEDSGNGQAKKPNDYIDGIGDEVVKRSLFEVLLEEEGFGADQVEKAFKNCVDRIRANYLKKKSAELQEELIAAEKAGNDERCRELLELKKTLIKGDLSFHEVNK